MMLFCELPEVMQGLLCVLAVFLYILHLIILLYCFRQKKKNYLLSSLLMLGLIFLVIQAILERMAYNRGENSRYVAEFVGHVPGLYVVFFLGICSFLGYMCYVYVIRPDRNRITPMSVKYSIDRIQAGICYYREDGRVVLSNKKMDELCKELTGEQLMNGKLFLECVGEDKVSMKNGKVFSLKHRLVQVSQETLHELVAIDITEWHKKNLKLSEDAEALKKMNESLRIYNRKIDETVRLQEILQAKMFIHDEMNRIMLLTSSAMEHPMEDKEFNDIMTDWCNNMELLRNEADRKNLNKDIHRINQLGRMLGVEVHWGEEFVREITDENKEIFLQVIREALTNAVKHGDARNLFVGIHKGVNYITFSIGNDGAAPMEPMQEGGGLSNIRRMVEEKNGNLSILWEEKVVINVTLPAKTETYSDISNEEIKQEYKGEI